MKRILFSLVVFISFTCSLNAQNFSSQGFYISNDPNMIDCAAMQPDGDFLIAGSFHRYGKSAVSNFVRIRPDGTLDTAFSRLGGTDGGIYHMCVAADGSIFLQGGFTQYRKQHVEFPLIKLDPSGELDAGFQPHLSHFYVSQITAICGQPDGKILLAGTGFLSDDPPGNNPILVRLNKDGSLDETFAACSSDQLIKGIFLQPDGRIIVYGFFEKWNNSPATGVVRLNVDGNVDPGFALQGSGLLSTDGNSFGIESAILLNDSGILLAGRFNYYNTTPIKRTVKLHSDGTLDPTFNLTVTPAWLTNVAQLSDGGIVLSGDIYVSGVQQWFVKVKPDGSLFSSNSYVGPELNQASFGTTEILPIPNGEFFAAGPFTGKVDGVQLGVLNRFDVNAQPYFNLLSSFRRKGIIVETAIDAAHRIVVVGNFNQYGDTVNPQPCNYIARLLPDGSLDPDFNATGTNGYTNCVDIQKDGQIVVAGAFSTVNGAAYNAVARLNQNGEVDSTFNIGAGPDERNMYDIHISNDQHIYVAGSFRNFDNNPHKGIARLNSDGTIDNDFMPDIPGIYSASSITTTANGAIIFGDGSESTLMDLTTPMRVVKVDTHGTPDATFTPPVLDYPVTEKIRIATNGDIYWTGHIYHNTVQPLYTTHPIIKLHADGSLDEDAYHNVPTDLYVKDFEVLPTGKLAVVALRIGYFDSLEIVMRLNPDLSIDSSFMPVALPYNLLHINHDGNDRIIIAGEPVQQFRFETEQIQNIAIITKNGMEVQANDSTIRNMLDTANFVAKATNGYAEQQFTITNQSNATIELLDAGIGEISGENSSDFTISTNHTGRSLNPKESLQFTLRYLPSSNGKKNIKIQIPFSDGVRQAYIIPVIADASNDSTTTPVTNQPKNVSFFPNPTRGSGITVKSDVIINSYEIFDLTGHRIQAGKLQGSGPYTINLQAGVRGLIVVKLKSGKNEFVHRVMKL